MFYYRHIYEIIAEIFISIYPRKRRRIVKKRFLAAIIGMTMIATTLLSGCGQKETESLAKEESIVKEESVKVTCENGVMVGKTTNNVVSFKGVPFAKAPVGDLRWRAPEAPDKSDEEIECFDYGYSAIQYEWPSEPASSRERSEDCLTLNIWMPEKAKDSKEPLPVMVFFHGGAYAWGGTGDPTYDGQQFVEDHQDVIFVTCNYRLGVMAWADFSQIEGGEDYTDVNLGLRDNIASLEWIQKNIAAFGGNPDNVTIFGESAGAFTTTGLLISPAARGLFKRVIAESGVVDLKDRSAAVEFANVIADATGAKTMDDLLAITGDEFIEIDTEYWMSDECCGAVADGVILPKWDDIDEALAQAAEDGIELVIGTNKDEWNYFRDDQEGETEEDRFNCWYNNDLTPYWEGVYANSDAAGKEAMDAFYEYEEALVPEEYAGDETTKDALVKSAFKTETWRYQAIDFADRYANAGGDVYMYLWNVPSTDEAMYKSAVHAVELSYVFNTLDIAAHAGDMDIPTAKRVQESWVNFAKSANPSISDTVWEKYDTTNRNTMTINLDGWKLVSDPSKTARELMKTIYPDRPVSYDGLYEYNIWE